MQQAIRGLAERLFTTFPLAADIGSAMNLFVLVEGNIQQAHNSFFMTHNFLSNIRRKTWPTLSSFRNELPMSWTWNPVHIIGVNAGDPKPSHFAMDRTREPIFLP